ncbi:hypothetical protein LZ31DRAFT_580280 [Colletotrichum somersetense]|nr:hypothetical protein LZ31DRAFT_580280 [Colletotrichum somersetense]
MCYACDSLGIDSCPNPPSDYEDSYDEEEELEFARRQEEQAKRELEQHPERQKRGGQQPQTKRLKTPPPKNKTIVYSAPSHDGSPAFVAYEVPETVANDDEAGLTACRPLYAFVIYDTTPEALRPGRTAELAQEIFERTYEERRGNDLLPDRIEVVDMPMPQLSPSDIWDSEKQWEFRMNPKPIESRGDGECWI